MSAAGSVLLVHSGGFTSRQWRKLAALLAPTHRVIAPDLLGYGANGPWPPGQPFHFRQDVEFLSSLVAGESGPVHLVGHSYGGLLALHLALARPGAVRSLALFEPVAFGVLDESEDADALAVLRRVGPDYQPDAGGVDESWLGAFVDWWNGPGAWANLGQETQASFRQVAWKLYQEVSSLMADRTRREEYAAVEVPVLLLGGERTPLPERRVIARLAAALPAATSRLFPDMGHMGPITHAAPVNQAIAEHIRVTGS